MGRIVAISGGSLESTKSINKYILKLSGAENPHVIFVPTASRDDESYIAEFNAAFRELGATTETLAFTHKHYLRNEIEEVVNRADVIYVGDGNLIYMMNIWRQREFDDILRQVFSNNSAVLSGLGAGCACWFNCGYGNSHYNKGKTDWNYMWADNLLDLHHTAVCPHYNGETRNNFDLRLVEKGVPGFALGDNTAFTQNGVRSMFLKSQDDAVAHYMVYLNGAVDVADMHLENADNINNAQ